MNYAFDEHNPPHIHAVYDNHRCSVDLNGKILDKGKMKNKQLYIVINFVKEHHDELIEMWNKQSFYKIKGGK